MYDLNSIYIAKTIDDAIGAMIAAPDATLICGGTDILVGLRDGVKVGGDFISIKDIEELKGIYIDKDKNIHIKPGTTFNEILSSDIIKQHVPCLLSAVIDIGGSQIRNIGTIGGNICNGFTTADAPPMLLGLNAIACITGKGTYRQKPVEYFYVKPEVMDLQTGELLTDIIIKHEDYSGYVGHYIKFSLRDAMDIAIIGCSVVCKTDGDVLQDIRISFAAAGPLPMRARSAEKQLIGVKINVELFETMGKLCLPDVSVITDKRVSKEFREHLVEVLPGRACKQALSKSNDKVVDAR
ncbi:MAG: xanthine dehydrogenase FAD-binding subunit XdhB [Clostridia bacterium]|jgi:xanthine dehydrogenase FAD-binding subunit|nr:xanthine dehydrogenase FAD-binding subunit XdhB [Clostridia bacterium]MBT7121503.1 xanthine dehydrogenase FAD-binding subunit XdhB [Clostridia bacterium]